MLARLILRKAKIKEIILKFIENAIAVTNDLVLFHYIGTNVSMAADN